MKRPLQLATLTIDLEEIGEIEEQDDRILVLFGPDHIPDKLILTGPDAALMHQHIQQERQLAIDDLTKLGWNRKELEGDIDPPPILDEPLF